MERSNHILGGSAGYSRHTGTNQFSTTTFNFSPMYGYFFYDRFLFGADLTINITGTRGRVVNFVIKGGPLVRYYFKNNIFIQGDYSLGVVGRGTFENDFYARLGYAFFLNNHVAIEPYLFYGYVKQTTRFGGRNPVTSTNNFSDYGIYFSIQVYLESEFNKKFKNKKGMMKPKEKILE